MASKRLLKHYLINLHNVFMKALCIKKLENRKITANGDEVRTWCFLWMCSVFKCSVLSRWMFVFLTPFVVLVWNEVLTEFSQEWLAEWSGRGSPSRVVLGLHSPHCMWFLAGLEQLLCVLSITAELVLLPAHRQLLPCCFPRAVQPLTKFHLCD